MAILEVGENHKFKKISKAVSESSDQDTIQIYGANIQKVLIAIKN